MYVPAGACFLRSLYFRSLISFNPIRRPLRKNVASTFTLSLLPDRPPNVTGRGRNNRNRRHTSTTNINMADSKRTLVRLFPIVHCVKTNTLKGGRGGVRFLFWSFVSSTVAIIVMFFFVFVCLFFLHNK